MGHHRSRSAAAAHGRRGPRAGGARPVPRSAQATTSKKLLHQQPRAGNGRATGAARDRRGTHAIRPPSLLLQQQRVACGSRGRRSCSCSRRRSRNPGHVSGRRRACTGARRLCAAATAFVLARGGRCSVRPQSIWRCWPVAAPYTGDAVPSSLRRHRFQKWYDADGAGTGLHATAADGSPHRGNNSGVGQADGAAKTQALPTTFVS